jgi:hypothetical protein
MAQELKLLSSKCRALSLSPSTTKIKQEKVKDKVMLIISSFLSLSFTKATWV